ncbi:CRP-like cAMP-binding protein [Lachnospiraceae bacterium PM6-15]|uniref:Crp/Fnr family transcriptional regulator n=1 Tax=Ohessyouella blattaphilus TaxID=2949333 RepID=A0ABT1EM48_9FIRM|nr:Crp/Fnr family transcriptional regulator [Ohessyouella blattaphilus]MCP1110776.1 Crp/Fnr family transcriptional regulator [Ohessyouella blattaphilus]MCR8564170.1 Crp/Fnr family transcriptional regulator [Ohessyouella blattaphilus]MDL2250037.1 Crp/Fnr family transcriptional regulator [Lachnospiraceae bacterium OttesenSCG-928-J05]
MNEKIEIVRRCPLFAGIEEKDMQALMACLQAKEMNVKKGETIFSVGERPDYIGIVLQGKAHVIQEDYWGNRTILTDVQAGDLFGEAFSLAEATELPVSVIAGEDSTVLLVDSRRILTSCSSACNFHTRLIRNLMKIIANKNIMLTRKMEHITKRTTREKVLSYLSACALIHGSNTFTIAFNRQEFADYLSVERSALSNTLCKMRDEGIIQFTKNKFTIN